MNTRLQAATETRPLIEAAHRYLPRTIPLFGKIPAVGDGWPQWHATPASLAAWFAEHGDRDDANIGIRTGAALIVIDVDPRHDGDLELDRLERQHGPLPASPEVLTGGGGRHIYFRGPRHLRSRDLRHDNIHGVEIKAQGCQVVAPPSVHPESGREYVWHPARPLIEAEIAPLPNWLAQLAGCEPIADASRAAVLAANDPLHRIPTVVYVPKLTGRQINHNGFVTCPFHKDGQERRPALKVYPAGGWKCHACGVGGRIYQLAGLLGGWTLPLTSVDRRAIRSELAALFAEELAG